MNEASPDLFRPAINTLYCIVTFYTQRTTSDKRQTRAFSVKVSTEDKICQRLKSIPILEFYVFKGFSSMKPKFSRIVQELISLRSFLFKA